MPHLRRCLRDSLWMQLWTEGCSLPPPFAHALVNLSLEATTAAPINSIVHLSEPRLRLRETRGSLFLSRLDFSLGLELIFYIVEHMPMYDYNENEHKTNIFCVEYFMLPANFASFFCSRSTWNSFPFLSLSYCRRRYSHCQQLFQTWPNCVCLEKIVNLARTPPCFGSPASVSQMYLFPFCFLSLFFTFSLCSSFFLWLLLLLLLLVMISCGDICKLQFTSTPSLC